MRRYRHDFVRLAFTSILVVLSAGTALAQQPPVTIEMITWDVVGLDSNDVNEGNNLYLVGARVCNTSGADLTNVETRMVWSGLPNLLISIQNGTDMLSEPVLAAGSCFDFFFNVVVTRTTLAFDTSRDYHIEVTADGFPTPVSNASENRQIYVERLISQNRNSNLEITGPPTAYVGGIFEFTMQAQTSTPYEQIESFIVFPNNVFQVISSETSYSNVRNGAAATVDSIYNDACGWISDQTDPDYNSCAGRGKAGGTLTQTYLVRIVDYPTDGSSSITLNGVIYDYSGSSFHYNANYNSPDSSTTWEIDVTPTPTAVDLEMVEAVRREDRVELSWRTTGETGNLGFHVWRELGATRERVTPSLVAGSVFVGRGVPMGGRTYSWIDSVGSADSTAVYWVEAFGLDGARRESGRLIASPASMTGDVGPPRRRSVAIDAVGPAREETLRIGAVRPESRVISASLEVAVGTHKSEPLAGREALKIWIGREGWYRVPGSAIIEAGLGGEKSQKLRLVNRGSEVAILIEDGGDKRIDAGDAVYFYGEGLETPYTDENVYWLTAEPKPGARIETVKSSRVRALGTSSFPFTVERKDRFLHFAALDNGPEGDNWFGPFLASVWNMDVRQTIEVTELVPSGMARIEVAMQGAEDRLGDDFDHKIAVSVNGSRVGTMVFDGWEHATESFEFPASLLREGPNEVLLVSQREIWDRSVLDRIRVTYPHAWRADRGELRFVAPAGTSVEVTGFATSEVLALDVTDPRAPFLLPASTKNSGNDWSVSVPLSGQGDRLVHLLTPDVRRSPVEVRPNTPTNWREANGADLVIIGHESLLDATAPLAEARRAEGYRVEVIDVEDLFDEFSDGIRTPHAIRDFFVHASEQWATPPRFAILMGDATADPNDYTGHGFGDFVPTRMLMTEFSKTASDDWFTDFDGDGGAEIPIGRFPARTSDEAATMVAKTLSYSGAMGMEWTRKAILVTDRNDPGGVINNFTRVSDAAATQLPSVLQIEKIYGEMMGIPAARSRLIQRWNEGLGLVNYYGHGTAHAWSSANLFTRSHARALRNGERLPVVTAMACLLSFFHDPHSESFGESLLRNPNGGAAVVWGSSGLTYLHEQVEMYEPFIQMFFQQGYTIGEAAAESKRHTRSKDVRQTWILFGDPTLRFAANR